MNRPAFLGIALTFVACGSVPFDVAGTYEVSVEHQGSTWHGHAVTVTTDGDRATLSWPSSPCDVVFELCAIDGDSLIYSLVPESCDYLAGPNQTPRTISLNEGILVASPIAIEATVVYFTSGPNSSRGGSTVFAGERVTL